MPQTTRFHYRVLDAQGQSREGELDAPHADAVTGELDRRGWRIVSLRPLANSRLEPTTLEWRGHDPAAGPRLTNAESEELSGHMAELVLAGLPLESGLASIAEELPARRLRRAMREIVRRLERGADLDWALRQSGAPPYLQAVVRAGSRAGSLGDALEQYAGTSEALRGTLPIVLGSLGYAAMAFALWLGIALFLILLVLPSFSDVYEGFGITLPWLTRATLGVGKLLRENWLLIGLSLAAVPAVLLLMFRPFFGRVTMRRLLHSVPGLGTVVRSLAMCRFSILLSLLVQSRVPLPESLELAGDATSDPAVAADARRLAQMLNDGTPLEPGQWNRRSFSPGFVRALLTPCGPEGLIDGLQSLSEVFAARVRYGLVFLAAILPPFFVITLGICTAVIVVALYLPLIQLLKLLA